MAYLSAENPTFVFITAPQPSSLSTAPGFEEDVAKKRQDKIVLENGSTILLRAARLHGLVQDVMKKGGEDNQATITHDLKHDVATKKEDQKVLENLKKELEAKYRKFYMVRLFWIETNFEIEKISFTRAMEKAWFMNSIIKERCLISCNSGEGNYLHKVIEKVMEFNKKIKHVILLGLDGHLFGASNKRKCSSYEAYDQVEEELEELENLMECNREMMPPPEDTENFRNYCKRTCRRAYLFAKLESREEYLEAVINSLRERERETKPTENEILGYMLLQEISNSTLHNTSRELLNSITLSSSSANGDGQDKNIHVQFNELLYTELANAKSNFEMLLASRYDAFVMNAKSRCNNTNNEVEQIKEMLSVVEMLITEGNESIVTDKRYQNAWVVERRYERELFKYCENLSFYMRLGRCLNPLSKTEEDRVKEIGRLACDAIRKYTQANGPNSLSVITQPRLPTWRNY